jgi:hypothetical protein
VTIVSVPQSATMPSFPLTEDSTVSVYQAVSELLHAAWARRAVVTGQSNALYSSTWYEYPSTPTQDIVEVGTPGDSDYIAWTNWYYTKSTNAFRRTNAVVRGSTKGLYEALGELDEMIRSMSGRFVFPAIVDNYDAIFALPNNTNWTWAADAWHKTGYPTIDQHALATIGSESIYMPYNHHRAIIYADDTAKIYHYTFGNDVIYAPVFGGTNGGIYGCHIAWTNNAISSNKQVKGYYVDDTDHYYATADVVNVTHGWMDYLLLYPASMMVQTTLVCRYEYLLYPYLNDVVAVYPKHFTAYNFAATALNGRYELTGYETLDRDFWWAWNEDPNYRSPVWENTNGYKAWMADDQYVYATITNLESSDIAYAGPAYPAPEFAGVRIGSTIGTADYDLGGKLLRGGTLRTSTNYDGSISLPGEMINWWKEACWVWQKGNAVIGPHDITYPSNLCNVSIIAVPGTQHVDWVAFQDNARFRTVSNYPTCLPWGQYWTNAVWAFNGTSGLPTIDTPILETTYGPTNARLGWEPWMHVRRADQPGGIRTDKPYTNIPNVGDRYDLAWTNPMPIYGFFDDDQLSYYSTWVAWNHNRRIVHPDALNARWWLLHNMRYVPVQVQKAFSLASAQTVIFDHRCDDDCSFDPDECHIDPDNADGITPAINVYARTAFPWNGSTVDINWYNEWWYDDEWDAHCHGYLDVHGHSAKYSPSIVLDSYRVSTNGVTNGLEHATVHRAAYYPDCIKYYQKRKSWTYHGDYVDQAEPYKDADGVPSATPSTNAIIYKCPGHAAAWPETHDNAFKLHSEVSGFSPIWDVIDEDLFGVYYYYHIPGTPENRYANLPPATTNQMTGPGFISWEISASYDDDKWLGLLEYTFED